ncbi:phage virion morphogenesis protein [Histophilus somni]|uniref:Phage virion morphogenesis protein n=1 Tax=Histophilus somni TaxID=731 RepID=A0AAX2S1B5_HISSO|nr:phage virion morphogenesis protein [Histophilus somni]TEW31399.1 phage virion morphogenesis protein [Histophilus somni]THA97447.1 phage virion morphogenesis protein [Histophilus somni]
MHLEFKFDTSAIQANFRRLQEAGKSEGLTRKIANVLRSETEHAFDNEQSPEGEKWKALDPAYKKQRHGKGYTGNTLQVSGDLVASLNIGYGDSFAMIGAAEPYGQYHQQGTSKMAARPFIGLGKTGQAEIKAIIAKRLKEAFAE